MYTKKITNNSEFGISICNREPKNAYKFNGPSELGDGIVPLKMILYWSKTTCVDLRIC